MIKKFSVIKDFLITIISPSLEKQSSSLVNLVIKISEYMWVTRYVTPLYHAEENAKVKRDDISKILSGEDAEYVPVRIRKERRSERSKVNLTATEPAVVIRTFKEFELSFVKSFADPKFKWETLSKSGLGYMYNDMELIRLDLIHLSKSLSKSQPKELVAIATCVLTLLSIARLWKCKVQPDFSTVTAPLSENVNLDNLLANEFSVQNIRSFLTENAIKLNSEDFALTLYGANASGPSGGHSDVSLVNDLNALYTDTDLFRNVCDLLKLHPEGNDVVGLVNTLLLNLEKYPASEVKDRPRSHSRLVTFVAPGAKARIIAIVDWLTQTSLSGLHKGIFSTLRQLGADATFSHKGAINIEKTDFMASVDLTAATDRMPRKLQSRLIAGLYDIAGMDGESISNIWLNVVDRNYSTYGTALYSQSDKKEIRYEVGQGMGMLGSWGAMAITHHYMLYLSGASQRNYRLVGDDLIINSRDVFIKYVSICKLMGIEVNPTKTVVSETGNTYEIARNFVIEGNIIVPYRIGDLLAFLDRNIRVEALAKSLISSTSAGNEYELLSWIDNITTLNLAVRLIFFTSLLISSNNGGFGISYDKVSKLWKKRSSERFFTREEARRLNNLAVYLMRRRMDNMQNLNISAMSIFSMIRSEPQFRNLKEFGRADEVIKFFELIPSNDTFTNIWLLLRLHRLYNATYPQPDILEANPLFSHEFSKLVLDYYYECKGQ